MIRINRNLPAPTDNCAKALFYLDLMRLWFDMDPNLNADFWCCIYFSKT